MKWILHYDFFIFQIADKSFQAGYFAFYGSLPVTTVDMEQISVDAVLVHFHATLRQILKELGQVYAVSFDRLRIQFFLIQTVVQIQGELVLVCYHL